MKCRILSASISAVLLGALSTNTVLAQTDDGSRGDVATYLIEFDDPGMLSHQGPQNGARFDPRRPDAVAYQQELMRRQAEFKQTMSTTVGRPVEVTHHYLATHSGIAAKLSKEEVELLAGLPGVASIKADTLEYITTQRGPSFIGANTIWNGSSVPVGSSGTRGEGMVIGVLDSGSVSPHPSFTNDASCGHGTTQPAKVISQLDCSATSGTGLCNGANPIDTNGHGSHTASTSGGNALDQTAVPAPAFQNISGVAPCASLRVYKVCPGSSCPGADIQAGLNSVLLHGDVDAVNFSISGGANPWTDNDRRKLDLVDAGVIVLASAGNTSEAVPNPVGQVNHRGPWVMSVAASTHDQTGATGSLSASGPGTPPANTQNLVMTRGSFSPNGTNQTNLPIRHFTGQAVTSEGCTPGEDGVPASSTTPPP